MAGKREWGSERRGDDDDGDAPVEGEQKVQIENTYFEKMKARLGSGHNFKPDPVTAEPEEGKPAGPVIYNGDGSIYKRP